MGTKNRPIPQVQALAYKGTPEKPDIKIFVSHRIDLDSETIDNPLYIPVRCGAVFDEREGITMLGDDTGDNISDKRLSFCELTVQYWAWKNIKADYYGFCHYRRYLSFSDNQLDDPYVHEKYITEEIVPKYGLLESTMRKQIEAHDVILATPRTINKLAGCSRIESNYEYFKARPLLYRGTDAIDLLASIIKEIYPDYIPDMEHYWAAPVGLACNCYIMKREIFYDYSQWLFDILFQLEERLDTSGYSLQRLRAPAFMSEPLSGIYFLHQQRLNKINAGPPHQIIFFEHPERIPNLMPAYADANIPVVIPASNYYAPYVAVCLKSILCHISENYNYDFIILSADMSEENKRILGRMKSGCENVSIRFYNPEPWVYSFKDQLQIAPRINLISFYRVAIPYFLTNYKKVICIDSDLIFETDIARLYQIPIGNKYLAGVRDVLVQGFLQGWSPRFVEYCQNEYNLKDLDNYINTGVAIYNLEILRERYSFKEVMELSSAQTYHVQEQDVINLLIENNSILIDERWNVYTYCNGELKTDIDYAPLQYQLKYDAARKAPFVIHWAGHVKPWQKPDDDFADRFWYYARMSPLYEIILHRMMWDVRNIPTPPVPPPPYRSKARKLADKVLPKGSRRRNLAKKILPKDSRQWKFCKKVYYKIFKR